MKISLTMVGTNLGGPLTAECAGGCGRVISLARGGVYYREDWIPSEPWQQRRWHPECVPAGYSLVEWRRTP